MKIYRIGFTGTREGLTEEQKKALRTFLQNQFLHITKEGHFHHGDCIGADEQASFIAREVGFSIYGHPPINPKYRAYFDNDVEFESKEYLVRNHDIVDSTSLLVACPKRDLEEWRSGSWATIRYAHKIKKETKIIFPNGRISSYPFKSAIDRINEDL